MPRKKKNGPPPDDFTVRLLRVETWLRRAEAALAADDADVAFVLYWIAFNAAYARDPSSKSNNLCAINQYFDVLLEVDRQNAVRDAISNECRDRINEIVKIEYLLDSYWDYANTPHGAQQPKTDWKQTLNEESQQIKEALDRNNRVGTQRILEIVFARIYLLRNQLMHGGAKFESHYNRDSVWDGAHIMARLVPIFLRIMRANKDEEWGRPFFRPGLQGKHEPSIVRRRDDWRGATGR